MIASVSGISFLTYALLIVNFWHSAEDSMCVFFYQALCAWVFCVIHRYGFNKVYSYLILKTTCILQWLSYLLFLADLSAPVWPISWNVSPTGLTHFTIFVQYRYNLLSGRYPTLPLIKDWHTSLHNAESQGIYTKLTDIISYQQNAMCSLWWQAVFFGPGYICSTSRHHNRTNALPAQHKQPSELCPGHGKDVCR